MLGGGFGRGGVERSADGELQDAQAAVAPTGEKVLPTDVFVEAEFVVRRARGAVILDDRMEDVDRASAVAEKIALKWNAEAAGLGGPVGELAVQLKTGRTEADARIVNDESRLHGRGARRPVEVECLPLPRVVVAPLFGIRGVGKKKDVEGALGDGNLAGVVAGSGWGEGPHDGRCRCFAFVPAEPSFAADRGGEPEDYARGGKGRGYRGFQI